MIYDTLLIVASVGLLAYCVILSFRVKSLQSLDAGIGKAITEMADRTDKVSESIARIENKQSLASDHLEGQIEKGEKLASRLELLLASMHDLPIHDASKNINGNDKFLENRILDDSEKGTSGLFMRYADSKSKKKPHVNRVGKM